MSINGCCRAERLQKWTFWSGALDYQQFPPCFLHKDNQIWYSFHTMYVSAIPLFSIHRSRSPNRRSGSSASPRRNKKSESKSPRRQTRDRSSSKSPRRGHSKSVGSDRSRSGSPQQNKAEKVQQDQQQQEGGQSVHTSNGAGDAGQGDKSKENGDSREGRDSGDDDRRDSSRSPSQDWGSWKCFPLWIFLCVWISLGYKHNYIVCWLSVWSSQLLNGPYVSLSIYARLSKDFIVISSSICHCNKISKYL